MVQVVQSMASSSHTFKIAYAATQVLYYPSLVLVKPRKTRPYITERLLMGCKESNQTKKQTGSI